MLFTWRPLRTSVLNLALETPTQVIGTPRFRWTTSNYTCILNTYWNCNAWCVKLLFNCYKTTILSKHWIWFLFLLEWTLPWVSVEFWQWRNPCWFSSLTAPLQTHLALRSDLHPRQQILPVAMCTTNVKVIKSEVAETFYITKLHNLFKNIKANISDFH